MFDNQAPDDDPGIDGGVLPESGKCPIKFSHIFVPREMVRKAHPSIFWIQFHLVEISKFLKLELMFRSVFCHIQTYMTTIRINLHIKTINYGLIY